MLTPYLEITRGPQTQPRKTFWHPKLGIVGVSGAQHAILATMKNRIKKRWTKGLVDVFRVLDRFEVLHKNEFRSLLSALSLQMNEEEAEGLWKIFDPSGSGRTSWADFRQCFEIPEDESSSDAQTLSSSATPSSKGKTARLKKVKKRSNSNPPKFSSEHEELKDTFKSCYQLGFNQEKEPDFYSSYGPLGQRGFKEPRRPASRMRPMSSASMYGSEDFEFDSPTRKLVQFDDSARRSSRNPRAESQEMEPVLQPFSNVGSSLKMSWRRWSGGQTLGASKTNLQDPAAPGESGSLIPGSGEFNTEFTRRQLRSKELEDSLSGNPNISWDESKHTFRVAPGFFDQDKEEVRELFPRGLGGSAASEENTSKKNFLKMWAASKPKYPPNTAGYFRKEQTDKGDAALFGDGTFWRDAGGDWKAVSKDFGAQVRYARAQRESGFTNFEEFEDYVKAGNLRRPGPE
mmetsp:Transcript_24294/g.38179  ORF Transcript_24294/g.38179 Transcript_24294/m.38179 type:complete len:459 (+) Transcript_24294:2-1378(+)